MTATFNLETNKVPEHFRGADLMLEGREGEHTPDAKTPINLSERELKLYGGIIAVAAGLALAGGISKVVAGDMFGSQEPVSDQDRIVQLDNFITVETPD